MPTMKSIAKMATILNAANIGSAETKKESFNFLDGVKDVEKIAVSALTLDFEALGPEFFKIQTDLTDKVPCAVCKAAVGTF